MKIRWQIVARCGNAPIRNEKCHRSLRPAGSSGSCSSWHLRSTVAASRTSLYRKLHQHSSPRLSRSRGVAEPGIFAFHSPPSLEYFLFRLSSCLSTLSSMYAHAVHLVPQWSLVSTSACIAKQPTLMTTAFPFSFLPPRSNYQKGKQKHPGRHVAQNYRIQRGFGRKITSQCTWLTARLPNSSGWRGQQEMRY